MYDGRKKFSLAKYWETKYGKEVNPGTTVTILFSIKRGNIPEDAKLFDISDKLTGVYLNVLAVIVIAEPSDSFSMDTTPDPATVHGVDKLPRLEDFTKAGSKDGNGDVMANECDIEYF